MGSNENDKNEVSDKLSASPAPRFLRARFFLESVFELVQVSLIALAIILPVRYFLVQPFYVKGASMEPNFYDKEYLIIDEMSYRLRAPARGEIIVFRYPYDPSQFFIKRIIGLPGEKVEMRAGSVKIYTKEHPEGAALDESAYLVDGYTAGDKTVLLKDGEYFLLGDNRNSSLDSRTFGPVKESLIVGRVWLRGWPFARAARFVQPPYNF